MAQFLGTIEPDAASTAGKAEWVRLIDAHPQLSTGRVKHGANPFSKTSQAFRPALDAATVTAETGDVGAIHWAMDDSRKLAVWAQPGFEGTVRRIAEDVAARLGWHFVVHNTA